MPVSHHPVFKQPHDANTAIWRYMDFTKFISTLDTRALYFARADTLGDPFEGSYSKANERMRPTLYAGIPPEAQAKLSTHRAELAKQIRLATFVNCWHMNANESAGMWKLYAQTNEAVAIRSSYFRLANELDSDVYLGMVEYIDFDRDWLPEGNSFYPYVHKRESFAHEREVRAVTLKIPERNGAPDFTAPQPVTGMLKEVKLEELVESIYVAPTCSPWFRSLGESVCVRYGLNKPVRQSSLDAEPFF